VAAAELGLEEAIAGSAACRLRSRGGRATRFGAAAAGVWELGWDDGVWARVIDWKESRKRRRPAAGSIDSFSGRQARTGNARRRIVILGGDSNLSNGAAMDGYFGTGQSAATQVNQIRQTRVQLRINFDSKNIKNL